ncbi:MAG: hypothetical protein IPK82_37155 [Polyangiaceae bacterium]|nr:hypothetical protein [Polyangiaceae bacterium]
MRPISFGALAIGAAVAASPLAGCNLLTGAENLELYAEGESGGNGGKGGSGAGTGAGPTGTGGDSTTTTTTPPVVEMYGDAPGVTITQLAMYQGVKRPIMENGAASSTKVPVVAGREGVLRAFVATDGNFDGQPVIARLFLNGSETPVEETVSINGNPQEAQLNSTLNFKLSGADIPVGFSFRLELTRKSTETLPPNPGAKYPAQGFAQTDAKTPGNALKITLVPVSYGADGSNRLPDTSAGQIEAYRKLFYGMYPVPEVQITVRNPVQWDSTVSANGGGWEDLLSYIGNVRSQDNAPFDVYYYGIFSPASSVGGFCGGGCVAGLGNIGGVNDAYARAAIGLGFTGDIATETAVHEIGHTHGRYHAPCGGAQGTDPNFPYSGAKIGAWGFDLTNNKLWSPSNTVDLMSYCTPIWVSDYTFTAFFNRIKAVNGAQLIVPEELKNLTYDRARVYEDGKMRFLPPIKLETPPFGEPVDVAVESDVGGSTVTAQYYPYDHLPGGVLVWPRAGGPTKMLTAELFGKVNILSAE